MADAAAQPAPDAGSAETPAVLAARWIAEIEIAEKDKDRQRWLEQCKRILKVYKADQPRQTTKKRFALFWSSMQTIAPAIWARTPTAVVTRRFKDADPVGRLASEVLERSANFALDSCDFASVMLGCRDEYLLLAQGSAWVRYVPTMRTEAGAAASEEVTDTPESYEVVDWEEVIPDRVHYEDFLHNPARSWEEVRWVARRVFMTRGELVARFPECGANVPLDWAPEGQDDAPDDLKKGAVYEIWDRISKRAIWICKTYPQQPLDVRSDPLRLKGFFPCPKPVFGTCGPDSIVPTPDFIYWEDQAGEIDKLTTRIDKLIDALRVRGFYSSKHEDDLNQLFKSEDNTLIPVDSWAALGDDGGLKGIIDWYPVQQVAEVLKACFDTRRQLIDDVYQLTGISDIQRGATDPNETAAAQQLKASWGGLRVRDRRKELERFSRDLIRIMSEIIASRFDAKTLAEMTGVDLLPNAQAKAALGQQLQAMAAAPPGAAPPPDPALVMKLGQPTWDDVMGLLRNPALRAFRIDVETDSTIEPNEQVEKASRVEFVQAVGKYLSESLPVVQAQPAILPVITQGLMFLVRGFRVGREMEDVIDRAMEQIQQAAQSAPPPGAQQDPADMAKAQAAQASAQAAVIGAQAKMQANQIEAARVQSDHQIGMAQVGAENARTMAEGHASARADMLDAIHKAADRRAAREAVSEAPLIGGGAP
jgi:hypothetical protein